MAPVGCSVHHNRGKVACQNDVKFRRDEAEKLVLDTVQTRLFTPATVERFLSILTDELVNQNQSDGNSATRVRKDLLETEKGISNYLKFIKAGNFSPSVTQGLSDLESKKLELLNKLAQEEQTRQTSGDELQQVKAAGWAALQDLPALLVGAEAETRAVLANLIGKTVVAPSADKLSLEIRITGHMAGLLQLPAIKLRRHLGDADSPQQIGEFQFRMEKAGQKTGSSKHLPGYFEPSLVNVVARVGFEPTTFGL